jgi:RNA-splicing ligase RtcB
MIIPFNMEDGTLICEGKSNPEWNYSAPHGAGRLFSRGDAKRKLKLDKAKADMKAKGIYSSVNPLDEVRSAYKPAEVIEQAIGPTATIVHRIRPLMNFKAGEEEK